METIESVRAMQHWADEARAAGRRIGFVPTMGYLHEGHLSLVRIAREQADTVVASIFVNPTQFGPNEDLDAYPRDLEGDASALAGMGTDVLFFPTAEEMYPVGAQTSVHVEQVTRGLCGASRPVHFGGVATVVTKLFNIVKPHVAVFGRKDYQQLVTIRRLVEDLRFDVEVVGGPIVREPDGLAMSSRNAYLSPEHRRAALCLSRSLAAAEALVSRGVTAGSEILAAVRQSIEAEPLAELDYAELVDADTLEAVDSAEGRTLLAVAAQLGAARLIDNCVLNDAAHGTLWTRAQPARAAAAPTLPAESAAQ